MTLSRIWSCLKQEQFTENNWLNYQDGQDATQNQFDDTGLYNPETVSYRNVQQGSKLQKASFNLF